MISELEQCVCGIIFDVPVGTVLTQTSVYSEHVRCGQHRRAFMVHVCGPCFAGLCGYCEEHRELPGAGCWGCSCTHEDFKNLKPQTSHEASEFSFIWSEWLINHCPSERDMPL